MNTIDELFYQDKEQLTRIVDEFATAILPLKNADQAFFSKYRTFRYSDELRNVTFPYTGQKPADFIDEFAGYFENAINYDNTGVMYNVLPNPNIYGQVASLLASFANPNFCMDLPSGKLMVLERAVLSYMAKLAGWNEGQAGGVFTFGGKGTLLYALKVALDKIDPHYRKQGIKDDYYVISNDLGHPSHIQVCNWTGIGEDKCIRLKTHDSVVDVADFERAFEDIIAKGGKLPLIFINGMTTNNHSFDDVAAIRDARDKIVTKYGLDYVPHLHVDSVLGWVYLVIGQYDFSRNPVGVDERALGIMRTKSRQAAGLLHADSFAADFHKTGFCNYVSSAFIIKDKQALFSIEGNYSETDDMVFSEYAPYDYTLESSRSPHGPVAAFTALKTIGTEGFVRILANHTDAYLYLKDAFKRQDNTIVCNADEDSNVLFLAFKPKHLEDVPINERTPESVADEIKRFNTGFYSFILEKNTQMKSDMFFSASRSYKYFGKSYGCLKLYSFNSHLDGQAARHIHARVNQLLEEYVRTQTVIASHKVFDYAELKGDTSV